MEKNILLNQPTFSLEIDFNQKRLQSTTSSTFFEINNVIVIYFDFSYTFDFSLLLVFNHPFEREHSHGSYTKEKLKILLYFNSLNLKIMKMFTNV